MNINTAFPSKYLRAADLGAARPVVTIERVEMEDVGGDHRPVLYFAGKEKGIVLNKTNSSMITTLAGSPDTDTWSGLAVRLYSTPVSYQGKTTDAIRIEAAPRVAPKPAPNQVTVIRPAPMGPPPQEVIAEMPSEDEVPF